MGVDYSVVVPVFQGEGTLRPLVARLHAFFAAANFTHEIILVHDGGPDNSWTVIQELHQQMGTHVKGVQLSRNFGQHNALICGFGHATGRFIITLDEDLQHRPEDIALLIAKQQADDLDVVYGKAATLKHAPFRNVTSRVIKRLLRIGIPELHPDYSAFRLIKRDIARYCLEMRNSYTFLDGYLSWITDRVGSVEITHQERTVGKSSYTLEKLINHSINIFVTFSDLPVRILSITSILVFLVTLGYSTYVLIRKLVYNDFLSGFPSLIIAIGFGVGLIMLGMGILGEYIHRISLKTTRRPNFVERETLE